MMKEEVRRNLPEAKLSSCYNRLIELISRFNDPVGSTHCNWEEARANHDRIQAPSVNIIGKISQPEGDQVLENFRLSVGKEDRVVQTLIENPKPS
jgi:hypothetical protein